MLGSLPQRRFAAYALTVGALSQLFSFLKQQPRFAARPKAAHGTADGMAIRMRSRPWRLPKRQHFSRAEDSRAAADHWRSLRRKRRSATLSTEAILELGNTVGSVMLVAFGQLSKPSVPRRLRLLLSVQRGAAAVEAALVMLLLTAVALPVSDICIAVLQTMSAHQALRDMGAYAQYHTPSDVTSWSSWATGLPSISGYSITTTVLCGSVSTQCSATNTASPKWFSMSTNVTFAPLFPALSFITAGVRTVTYTERFQ
jgi:Flp pilus assembly protein TadG